MTTQETLKSVKELVINFLSENSNLIPVQHRNNPESISHIQNIGTSILCTKWKVGYPGGSFVQSVVDNRLSEAFGRADSVNQDCMKFYVLMMANIAMPMSFLD